MREDPRKDASGGRKDFLACSSRAQSVKAGKAMVGRPVCEAAGLPAPAVRKVRRKCWSSAHSCWSSLCMEAPKGHCMKALRCGDTRTTGYPEEGCRHGIEMGQERSLVCCGTELAGQAPSSLFDLKRCHQQLQMPESELHDLVFSLLGFSLASVWPFLVMPASSVLERFIVCHLLCYNGSWLRDGVSGEMPHLYFCAVLQLLKTSEIKSNSFCFMGRPWALWRLLHPLCL